MVPITYVYLDLCGYIIGYPLCMYPPKVCYLSARISTLVECVLILFFHNCVTPKKTLGVYFFIFLDCSSLLVQSVDISGVSKNTKNQQTVLQLTVSKILYFFLAEKMVVCCCCCCTLSIILVGFTALPTSGSVKKQKK